MKTRGDAMKMGNVWMMMIAVTAMMMAGCELVSDGDPIAQIASDNVSTADVMREAFRNGTFDDALASVMEDSIIAEEVFSVVHGHPLLTTAESLSPVKQMTPAEHMRLLTSPSTRLKARAVRPKAIDEQRVMHAPRKEELDETMQAYLRLERGDVSTDTSSARVHRGSQIDEETWTGRAETHTSPDVEREVSVVAPTAASQTSTARRDNPRADTPPGGRAVQRRNARVSSGWSND
jgi:hypothetical protein